MASASAFVAFATTLLLLVASCMASPVANGTLHCTSDCQDGGDPLSKMTRVMEMKLREHSKCVHDHVCPTLEPSLGAHPCVNGQADGYECNNVDLLSYVSITDLGARQDGNDIWGWTSPKSGREVAIIGLMDGTSFVDVTTPHAPVVLGFMPTRTVASIWRDIKVYADHAFVVSEARDHGMQVVDLEKLLRDADAFRAGGAQAVSGAPAGAVFQVVADAVYDEFGSSHNIVINEETAFAYSVGTKTCSAGLHMVDISEPLKPAFAGCFSNDGYTHDAQCVIYRGPDSRFHGREVCFNYNEDTLTIVDVHDKKAPKMLARVPYQGSQYTHQGWLTADETHLLMNDELDEQLGTNPHTRTMVWSVEKLDAPHLVNSFYSKKKATDHNLYIHEGFAYEANYAAGLRILKVGQVADAAAAAAGPVLEEVAFFDVCPDFDDVSFHGSWSVYPFFKSGTLIVSSIERGLFVLKANL